MRIVSLRRPYFGAEGPLPSLRSRGKQVLRFAQDDNSKKMTTNTCQDSGATDVQDRPSVRHLGHVDRKPGFRQQRRQLEYLEAVSCDLGVAIYAGLGVAGFVAALKIVHKLLRHARTS